MLAHARTLAEEPFFSGMQPEALQRLAAHAYMRRFDAGEYIFKEGEPATHFYIITGGMVSLEAEGPVPGRTVQVGTIGEWEALGWSWLLPPYRWHFDARATSTVEAITFDAVLLRQLCEEDHDLGYELTKRFAAVLLQRLQATRFALMRRT